MPFTNRDVYNHTFYVAERWWSSGWSESLLRHLNRVRFSSRELEIPFSRGTRRGLAVDPAVSDCTMGIVGACFDGDKEVKIFLPME